MANFIPNISLGQGVAYYRRVDENDPSTAELYVTLWNAGDTDATIRDADTVAAIEALSSTAEITLSGYSRKVLTDSDISTFSVDDTNDRIDLVISDQTWTSVATGTITDACVAYGLNGGADSAKVPISWHDFSVTTNGGDVTMDVPAAGFYRAASAT